MSPTYEYLCHKCDEAFEHWCNTSKPPVRVTCLICNQEAEKIISTFGLYQIKGDNSASTAPKCRVTTRKPQK